MKIVPLTSHVTETKRHRTTWVEAGPADGKLMIFVHGWPELGIVWRSQIDHFARAGWRCVAPDMRGYGGSSVPTGLQAYEMRELVCDLIELHDALGGAPAIWAGHDWGSPVISALAAYHPTHCRALIDISVPYFPTGFALPTLVPLVDRDLYPPDKYPFGQWDYIRFYQESFDQAAADFEADVGATVAAIFRAGSPNVRGKPAATADVRAKGGRFGSAHRAPSVPRDESMLSKDDYDSFVASFKSTGFRGADAWYLNDKANVDFALQAPDQGRLKMPVLFLNGAWDPICDTTNNRLADPMRQACADLIEVSIEGGHWLILERAPQVNQLISRWIGAKRLA